ncbi:hypothetical protein HYY74_05740 [Candidatus Woesearchaeota archaeon]|nr:hypothetical protein [Candidatus Woesearchaeota archaeon]
MGIGTIDVKAVRQYLAHPERWSSDEALAALGVSYKTLSGDILEAARSQCHSVYMDLDRLRYMQTLPTQEDAGKSYLNRVAANARVTLRLGMVRVGLPNRAIDELIASDEGDVQAPGLESTATGSQ